VIGRRGFLSLTAALVACRRAPARPAIAQRVVSTTASTTEALFAIGAGTLVVGRSRYCDYPPEVAALPSIGGYVDPSLEAILALHPDLVVGARGPIGEGLVRTLEERGIGTWFPETETIDQILAMLDGLGTRTGNVDGARALVTELRARRLALESALAAAQRPRVLLLFEKKPISAAGPGSFPDEMLRLAGGQNVLGEGARYATISLEKVLSLDPDVILDAEMAPTQTPFDETWQSVRAIREGRVVRMGDERVLRPGPRVLEGAATIARALHPSIAIP
jgi:iron complex transport system substrate-binding protein